MVCTMFKVVHWFPHSLITLYYIVGTSKAGNRGNLYINYAPEKLHVTCIVRINNSTLFDVTRPYESNEWMKNQLHYWYQVVQYIGNQI